MNETHVNQFLKRRPTVVEALALAEVTDTQKLFHLATELRDEDTAISSRIHAKFSFH